MHIRRIRIRPKFLFLVSEFCRTCFPVVFGLFLVAIIENDILFSLVTRLNLKFFCDVALFVS